MNIIFLSPIAGGIGATHVQKEHRSTYNVDKIELKIKV